MSPDALRFYEREGLLPAVPRSSGGARRYDPAVLDQLRVITALRGIGFGLAEVRDLLGAKTSPTVRGRVAAARASLERMDELLDEKECRLADARTQLASWRAELDAGEPWPDTPLPW